MILLSMFQIMLDHPNIEFLLTQLESKISTLSEKPLRYSNLYEEEWQAVRFLANDRNTVIKKGDKASCVVIWDCSDDIMEAEKELSDKTIYRDDTFNKNIILTRSLKT